MTGEEWTGLLCKVMRVMVPRPRVTLSVQQHWVREEVHWPRRVKGVRLIVQGPHLQ